MADTVMKSPEPRLERWTVTLDLVVNPDNEDVGLPANWDWEDILDMPSGHAVVKAAYKSEDQDFTSLKKKRRAG